MLELQRERTGLSRGSLHVLMLGGLALVGLVLSACSDSGTSIPTPRSVEDVGSGAESVAQDTPDGTWERYLRDIIAEQVANQEAKLSLFERYQDPDITAQNLGGLVLDIGLTEDKTVFNITGGTLASAQVEFDIQITFTNGDTDTRTCSFPLSLELDAEDEVWYVVNPETLAIFVVCG